jgi:hypothetical protein
VARCRRSPLWSAPGKLRAAARRWVERCSGGDDELAHDLRAFGLTAEAAQVDRSAQPFAVYGCNWPTVQIFVATWQQWRVAVGMGGAARLGMDWAQVECALRLSGIKRKNWPQIFNGLMVMEDEALTALEADS